MFFTTLSMPWSVIGLPRKDLPWVIDVKKASNPLRFSLEAVIPGTETPLRTEPSNALD